MAWAPKGNIKGPQGAPGQTGATGPQGPKGDQGTTGSQGAQGPAGQTGATGAQGPQGATGATGQAEKWWNGTGAPSSGLGVVGDMYLDNSNGSVYEKVAGGWSQVAVIKGPTGATGSQGPQGATGSQGPQGNVGPQGPQGPAGTMPAYASLQTGAITPTLPTVATMRHCGLAASARITPTASGTVLVMISCDVMAPQTSGIFQFQGAYGSGTAPAGGAAVTGTRLGISLVQLVNQGPFTLVGLIEGLAVGTSYWLDLCGQRLSGAGGSFGACNVVATELP